MGRHVERACSSLKGMFRSKNRGTEHVAMGATKIRKADKRKVTWEKIFLKIIMIERNNKHGKYLDHTSFL